MNTATKERVLWYVKVAHLVGDMSMQVCEETVKDETGAPLAFASYDTALAYAERLKRSPLADPRHSIYPSHWK